MRPIKKDEVESKHEEGKRLVKEADDRKVESDKVSEATPKPPDQPVTSVERKEGHIPAVSQPKPEVQQKQPHENKPSGDTKGSNKHHQEKQNKPQSGNNNNEPQKQTSNPSHTPEKGKSVYS
jgi:hypothetical protein